MNKFKIGDAVYGEDGLGELVKGKVIETYFDFYTIEIFNSTMEFIGKRFMYEDAMFFSEKEYWEDRFVKITDRINALVQEQDAIKAILEGK